MKKINTATTATCLLTCAVLAARADVERLAFDGWLSDEDQKMSADVELNSITGAAGWLGGGWVDASTVAGQLRRWVADGYFFDRGENALSFDLQSDDEGRSTTVKGVRIVLTRKHDGVYARIAQAGYQRKGARGAERLPPTEVPIATSATADGYGVDGLVLLTAGDRRVAFPGYFTSDAKSLGWQSLGGMTDFRAVISGGYAMFAQHAEGHRHVASPLAASVQLQSLADHGPKGVCTRAALVTLSEGATVSGSVAKFTYARRDALGADMGAEPVYALSEVVERDAGAGISVRSVSAAVRRPDHARAEEHGGFVGETATVWFENARLANILSFSGRMSGGYVTDRASPPATVCNVKRSENAVSVQYQIQEGALKCVGVTFTQTGNDVCARATYARVKATADTGHDFDSMTDDVIQVPVATTDDGDGYGVKDIGILVASEGGVVRYWTGAGEDARLSATGNWLGGTPPEAGDILVFGTLASTASAVNDYEAGTDFGGIIVLPGAPPVNVSGNAATFATVENRGGGKLTLGLPVRASGDLEPYALGPIAFENLAVCGAFAPQGTAAVELNGQSELGVLSLGNTARRRGNGGFRGVCYALSGCGTNAIARFSTFSVLQGETVELSGDNTFATELFLRTNATLEVTGGVSRFPCLRVKDGGVKIGVAEGATCAFDGMADEYGSSVTFAGPGRVAFGAGGLAATAAMTFDGVTLTTCGADWTLSGPVAARGSLSIDACDADGTARAISLADDFTLSGASSLSVVGGAVCCASAVTLPALEMGPRATLCCTPTTSLSLSGAADVSGAHIRLLRRGQYDGPVLTASSITGVPASVTDARGRIGTCEVREVADGRMGLFVWPHRSGLVLTVK